MAVKKKFKNIYEKIFYVTLIIILFVILFFFYKNNERVYLYFYSDIQNKSNLKLNQLLENLHTYPITINNIPFELRNKIVCFHVDLMNKPSKNITRQQKINSTLDKLSKTNNNIFKFNKNNLVIMDVVDHPGTYFPSIHSDIEWNFIQNNGFQIWSLEKRHSNSNDVGNMFLYYNKYLFNKYNGVGIYIRLENNKILIVKNCILSEIPGLIINKNYILESMSINDFMKNTKKYYLKFNEGDCIAFNKNILHCSDYRVKNSSRISFNYRVVIKNKNQNIHINKDNCGYVHKLNTKKIHNFDHNKIIHNANLFDFV